MNHVKYIFLQIFNYKVERSTINISILVWIKWNIDELPLLNIVSDFFSWSMKYKFDILVRVEINK